MNREFPADRAQTLYFELQSGELRVSAAEVDRVTVEVSGEGADDVVFEHRDDTLRVVAPRRTGFFAPRNHLIVDVSAPKGSHLATKLGSASVVTTGTLGTAHLTTGSGGVTVAEVDGRVVVKTGSGDIRLDNVGGEAEVKTGSGDIWVALVAGSARMSTGSGGIRVVEAVGTVTLKSGSGDLAVDTVEASANLSTASGDLRVGRAGRGQLQLKNVSGDIHLGIPGGTPVWTDITSNTGHVRSGLTPTGAPREGQDHVEVRAKTVTGDVYLEQL